MQLSHAEVGFRELLQGFIAVSARIARSAMLAISPVAVTYMLVTGGNGLRGGRTSALAELVTPMRPYQPRQRQHMPPFFPPAQHGARSMIFQ